MRKPARLNLLCDTFYLHKAPVAQLITWYYGRTPRFQPRFTGCTFFVNFICSVPFLYRIGDCSIQEGRSFEVLEINNITIVVFIIAVGYNIEVSSLNPNRYYSAYLYLFVSNCVCTFIILHRTGGVISEVREGYCHVQRRCAGGDGLWLPRVHLGSVHGGN